MKFRILAALLLSSFVFVANAQLKVGFKAGMNYYKLTGTLEAGESYKLNNGFHFGITFNYPLSEVLSLRSEILYSQNGTKHNFDGPSYYIFRFDNMRFPAKDNITIDSDISNAYVTFPIMLSLRPLPKWEVYGGTYFGFLINPVGSGELNFGGRFRQSMDLQFFNDDPGQFKSIPNKPLIEVTIEGEKRFLQQILGAYSFHEEKDGNLYKSIDYGLTAGFAYYLNPGFYIGLRMEYGLRDVTSNQIDRSLLEVEDDGTLIFRDDSDKPLGFQVSLGFRF